MTEQQELEAKRAEEKALAAKRAAHMNDDMRHIHEQVIKIQADIAAITNDIHAFGVDYKSDHSNAMIYIWTQSIEGSLKKTKGTAKANLTDPGKPLALSVGSFNVDVTYSVPGLSLDTVKFKKLDNMTYMALAKTFPKKSKPRATIRVSEKKGTV